MTHRPNCTNPTDCKAGKRGRHCLPCHARANALRNNATRVNQTDTARAKRTASYRATRVGYVPEGMEETNRMLRNGHIATDERKRMFGAQIVADNQREMRRRHERSKRQEY